MTWWWGRQRPGPMVPRVGLPVVVGTMALAVGLGGMSGCGANGSGLNAAKAKPPTEVSAGDRLVVVTTVAPLTSIVSAVVGDRAEVVGVVPEGTNSHTFEPQPSVAKVLSRADVIFINGLQLEEPVRRLAETNRAEGTPIVALGERTITADQYIFDESFPEAEGRPNPHLWTNPLLVGRYAQIVAEEMTALDPAGSAVYQANLSAFAGRIEAFDVALRAAFATIPADQRKLLTYHDAYAYFADEYGWEIIGAIQVSDFGDPTAKEVAALIDQVRATGVRAIFGSEVFPSPVLEQIGKEAGVAYIDELRDDDLPGRPGEAEHSLLGLLRFDFITLTEALGGDASALQAFELRQSTPDGAVYPQ